MGLCTPRGPRRWALISAVLLTTAVVVAGPALTTATDVAEPRTLGGPPAVAATDVRPNIVFVFADDLSRSLVRFMPHVLAMRRDGTTFGRYYVAAPQCCPSRASMLSGAYPHSTTVRVNGDGWQRFRDSGAEQDTYATALDGAGYRTGYVGKYLNGYDTNVPDGQPLPVPPGWDRWYAGDGEGRDQYGYTLNENGRHVRYGTDARDYGTDVLASKAVGFIREAAGEDEPFMLTVSTNAPHGPSTPPPRYADAFPDVRAPRPPSFNEPTVDPPPALAGLPELSRKQIANVDDSFRTRAQSSAAIDDLVARVQQALADTGQAGSTYLLFSSDNGFHMGEHRLPKGKQMPYETDIRVPLVVTGPGVVAGRRVDALASGVDLAPTFERIAGLTPSTAREGRSLLPWLAGETPTWRRALIAEFPPWTALVTADTVWVRHHRSRVREHYDLVDDPHQLVNTAGEVPSAQRRQLDAWADALATCSGATCRTLDTRA